MNFADRQGQIELSKQPLVLLPNRVKRYYRGGRMIDRFQGRPKPNDETGSEEWLASTTHVRPRQRIEALGNTGDGQPELHNSLLPSSDNLGLTLVKLPNGQTTSLKEVIDLAPESMLGEVHVQKFGKSMGLLVKMLDLAEPIPVHVHPNLKFAREYLGSAHGKAEAWIMLGAREEPLHEPPSVWLGFKRDVERNTLYRWVMEHDSLALYDSLHKVAFTEEQVLFVPAGMPHALGTGLFILEPQEPTDFSLTLEYWRYDLDPNQVSLGLEWEQALEMIDYTSYSREELLAQCHCVPKPIRQEPGGSVFDLLRTEVDQFFRARRMLVWTSLSFESLPQGHFVIDLVVEGGGTLVGSFGELQVSSGTALFLPSNIDSYHYERNSHGPLEIIRCMPAQG